MNRNSYDVKVIKSIFFIIFAKENAKNIMKYEF